MAGRVSRSPAQREEKTSRRGGNNVPPRHVRREFTTHSPRATERLGFEVTREAGEIKRPHALVIALDGPLGGGKTTFTKGIFKALGVKGKAVSPTFILMRHLRLPRGRAIYHIDLYRIADPQAIKILELREIFAAPGNVAVIEWAKHAARLLPKDAVWVSFKHGRKEEERVIIVRNGRSSKR